MHDTLAEYGRAVVKEMRALAAERDASTTVTTSAAADAARTAGVSGDDSISEGSGVSSTTGNGAHASSGNSEGNSENMGTHTAGTNVKGKAKSKKQKSKVSHVVDKMLFNYRNIGTVCLVLCGICFECFGSVDYCACAMHFFTDCVYFMTHKSSLLCLTGSMTPQSCRLPAHGIPRRADSAHHARPAGHSLQVSLCTTTSSLPGYTQIASYPMALIIATFAAMLVSPFWPSRSDGRCLADASLQCSAKRCIFTSVTTQLLPMQVRRQRTGVVPRHERPGAAVHAVPQNHAALPHRAARPRG
jgi:hypothetical protein